MGLSQKYQFSTEFSVYFLLNLDRKIIVYKTTRTPIKIPNAQNNKPISTYSLLLLHLTLGTKD
jgi:hypothetical protein